MVLGCDTIVALGGSIYGKPPDEEAARRTLGALAGRTHEVLSGLAVLDGDRELTARERTRVSFRELSERMIAWYVATGEWRGRAGGYAIQGAGAALVRSVEGDYENVVGLPLARLLDLYPALLTPERAAGGAARSSNLCKSARTPSPNGPLRYTRIRVRTD